MASFLSKLSLKAETKPIAYHICDLNGRLCYQDGKKTNSTSLRSVRFHMGGVPYDMKIADGKDEQRFIERFYSAIDRKEHRRSVLTYEQLCRRLLATAAYEEEYARWIEHMPHCVLPERLLCVSEKAFFRVMLQLYLYLGSHIRSFESYDDGEEYVRFVFRLKADMKISARSSDESRLTFAEIAQLLGHNNSFLYRYLVHAAIAAGADLTAAFLDGEIVFMIGVLRYDPLRFSFYGIDGPSSDEIYGMHAETKQMFASLYAPGK